MNRQKLVLVVGLPAGSSNDEPKKFDPNAGISLREWAKQEMEARENACKIYREVAEVIRALYYYDNQVLSSKNGTVLDLKSKFMSVLPKHVKKSLKKILPHLHDFIDEYLESILGYIAIHSVKLYHDGNFCDIGDLVKIVRHITPREIKKGCGGNCSCGTTKSKFSLGTDLEERIAKLNENQQHGIVKAVSEIVNYMEHKPEWWNDDKTIAAVTTGLNICNVPEPTLIADEEYGKLFKDLQKRIADINMEQDKKEKAKKIEPAVKAILDALMENLGEFTPLEITLDGPSARYKFSDKNIMIEKLKIEVMKKYRLEDPSYVLNLLSMVPDFIISYMYAYENKKTPMSVPDFISTVVTHMTK